MASKVRVEARMLARAMADRRQEPRETPERRQPEACRHSRMKGHYAGYSSHLLYICPDCGFEEVDFI